MSGISSKEDAGEDTCYIPNDEKHHRNKDGYAGCFFIDPESSLVTPIHKDHTCNREYESC
jgi:hypothetical protein